MTRVCIIFCMIWYCMTYVVFATEPNVAAKCAALVDAETGRLLWGKDADTTIEMASTTKIMTAILVLEQSTPTDVVTISATAAKQPDVQMDLQEGEQWYVGDLLRAMMLQSYNDAAVALAEHVSGSVESFCEEMTKKAVSIGANNTVFGSPNGLDSHLTHEQHHSTAYDMGLITAYALQNPTFLEVVQLPSHTFCDVSGTRTHTAVNTDKFLQLYAGALGVKTGYTNKAGHCFVGAAEQNDIRLISVVLCSGWGDTGKQAKWTDTTTLMSYGFETYHYHTIANRGDTIATISVSRSPIDTITGVLAEDVSGLLSQEELQQIQIIPHVPETAEAPITAGTKIGSAQIILNGTILYTVPVIATESAPLYTLSQQYQRLLTHWTDWTCFL